MVISSVANEMSMSWADSSLGSIGMDQVVERLKTRAGFGDKAGEVVEAYAKEFPGRKPVEIWTLASINRQGVVALADAKSKRPAGVYVNWFMWQPPLFDGRIRAFHCLDISFWFYNTDLMLTLTGGGARPRAVSAKMAGALLQFMKTGDPNGPGLPNWPKYTAEKGETVNLRRHLCGEERSRPRGAQSASRADVAVESAVHHTRIRQASNEVLP